MLTVLRYNKREYWTSELRAATGRSLIRHLLAVLNRPAVLMPTYVPEGVIGPCHDAGVSISFYDLNPDLTPNLESIRKNICPGALTIVIHYFGYPSPTYDICEIVKEANGTLFEDCAQTLYDDVSKARHADVALWSLNKFMPVTNGAILRSRAVNVNTFPKPLIMSSSHPERAYSEHLALNTKIAEVEQAGLELACLQEQSAAAYEDYYNYINKDYDLYYQTVDSQLIESQFDVEKEKAIRKTNAWRMRMVLPSLRNHGELPQFAFPLMCKSAEHREAVAERLLRLGILAGRQVDKWVCAWTNCPAQKDFADRHLLLPLGEVMHQELIGQIKGALW